MPFDVASLRFLSTMHEVLARTTVTALALFTLASLAGCSTSPQPKFQQELFDTGVSPYARNFNASSTDTCEAARRALLSQGYMTTMTRGDNDTTRGAVAFYRAGAGWNACAGLGTLDGVRLVDALAASRASTGRPKKRARRPLPARA